MIRWLIALYFWPTMIVGTIVLYSWIVLRHIKIIVLGRPKDGRAAHEIAILWGRLAFKIVPKWDIQVEGIENLPAGDEAMVVVANHESMSDIWAMYILGIQFRWLSKEEVFKIPFVGHAMKLAGYVPIRRGEKSSHGEAMRTAAGIIKGGVSMFFFPEGTRSADGQIKEFKSGAFRLARETKVRVLPVAIHGAKDLLRKGSLIPGISTVRVKVLPPAPPPPEDPKALDAYTNGIRDQIIAAHNSLIQ